MDIKFVASVYRSSDVDLNQFNPFDGNTAN
jgi:hypothetical protein